MTRVDSKRCGQAWIGAVRVALGLAAIGVLLYTYFLAAAAGERSLLDYFGYFTNLTSLLAGALFVAVGVRSLTGAASVSWLAYARAVLTSCIIIVGVIYNVLVPGTGSAPPWVSLILHVVFPLFFALDWILIGDRPALPWRRLWIVIPYPFVWLAIVLMRGATDGWVPYGFLLPENGFWSLTTTVLGLLGALIVAGTLVWFASRLRGVVWRRVSP